MITVAEIQTTVARNFQMPRAMLISEMRDRDIAHPRQVAMYLSRELTKHSLPTIGRLFHRDHSTVHHAIRAVERRMEADIVLATKVRLIRKVLESNERPAFRWAA